MRAYRCLSLVKSDVSAANNYLAKDGLESLGRVVSAYLDLAEERAKRKIPMAMEDWAKRLDMFLDSTTVPNRSAFD